jgi:isopentenyl-diphosphate delta-isomerase
MNYTEAKSGLNSTNDRRQPSIVLIDETGREIGQAPKIAAHTSGGVLHRAFSIYLLDPHGRLLLQRRADAKYHFAGLWSNTCCGHAVPNEALAITTSARLWDEMRVQAELNEVGQFVYEAYDPTSGLTEREMDHVFVGTTSGEPDPNPLEVSEWRWICPEALESELKDHSNWFTPWFSLGLALIKNSEWWTT